jgi:hypothetical protein
VLYVVSFFVVEEVLYVVSFFVVLGCSTSRHPSDLNMSQGFSLGRSSILRPMITFDDHKHLESGTKDGTYGHYGDVM